MVWTGAESEVRSGCRVPALLDVLLLNQLQEGFSLAV